MIRIHDEANVAAVSVAPKTKMQDDKTHVQQSGKDGILLWAVTALHIPEDGSKPELFTVTLPSRTEPVFIPMKTGFENLELGFYNMPNSKGGTNAGLHFRASGLVELEA